MIEFMINNIETLSAALAVIFLLIYSLYTKQWGTLRSAGLSLILVAQKFMATKEGSDRMEWVYAATWQKLPKWIRFFVTEKTLRQKL